MYKILIVDDEPLVRICLKTYLDWEKLGFVIVGEAADGVTALQMISDLHPDVVLLDIKMPKMGGVEVLEKLKNSLSEIKVIMLSSFNDFQTVREAFKRNAFDYIHKPTMTEESLRETFHLVAKAIEKQGKTSGRGEDVDRNMELQRQHVLKELMTADDIEEREVRLLFGEYRFFFRSESITVMHFQLRDYPVIKNRYVGNTSQRLMMVVSNLIRETLRTEREWEFLVAEENHYVLVLGLEQHSEGEIRIRAVADRIRKNVAQFLNADVVMGCGDLCPPPQIRKCYQEGLMALNYNLLSPGSAMLFYSQMQDAWPEDMKAEGHVARAVQYISQHYAEPLSLETVAQVVGLNKSYLSRIFKIRTGETLVNYINQVRIRKAAELLKKTERKSYEIAEMVGYNNVEYFNQVFKKIMGVSPREYR